jgi:hypothetical protein
VSAPVWPSYAAFAISLASLSAVGVNTWWSMHSFKETGHKVGVKLSYLLYGKDEALAHLVIVNRGRGAVDITHPALRLFKGDKFIADTRAIGKDHDNFSARLEGNSQVSRVIDLFHTINVFQHVSAVNGEGWMVDAFAPGVQLGNAEFTFASYRQSIAHVIEQAENFNPDDDLGQIPDESKN